MADKKYENLDMDLKEENLEEAEVNEDEEFENEEKDLNNSEDKNKLEEVISELKDENEKLNNEVEALKDRLLRISGEYDNYRKRTDKEKEILYVEACEDVLKEMLPVLDNLERAISAKGDIGDLKKGIDMTLKQFEDSFKKLGVEEISTENGFDPNLHNAVMHIEDSQYGEKEIVEVFLKGYKKGDKVIRHSMVKVAN
ncbi:nucleotide exchange factor GrpE [Clostridium cochlearium]|uniref:Protein GrpE n=1 Tax=Clostridium cochlearium TaxID=1494 RepID=A0ABY0QJG8_CLOCO|nr:nucleotide exchange factor GrpE [Clostridium cochlearium]MBV1820729.1 nucleotide exchange factor GrpE [Bacteroidales bacterium MSK.15.36]NSJ91474.1 nucleotide exchange factor GrpE [Coprococcus sp. MSK.21.13]MCG4571719.1 nucleotide exchange factor GrpE [Clostridium cochlearium]MCG4578642.1 nucleotide exchange factor GrpE [Clostridium cochlearium]MCR1971589.1 nucleotide exchange factor GrpE [Clostridium cochlearium]